MDTQTGDRMRRKLFIGSLLVLAALTAHAQGSGKLAVGPDAGGYLCPDGRQLYVKSCYDNSPDAKCGVVNMHLPVQNGFQRESTEIRSKLTPSVAACKIYPVEFRNDGTIGLVVPKSAPPQQTAKAPTATPAPSPATPAIPAPETRTALIRISGPGVAKTVHYVDEASVKPTGQKDVVEIWALQVFPNGDPDLPNASALWTRYGVDCKKNTIRLKVWGEIDRQGKVLSAKSTDLVQPIVKNSPTERIAAAACKSMPLAGSRMLTVAAAIADADSAAAPKTAAKPAGTGLAAAPTRPPASPPQVQAPARGWGRVEYLGEYISRIGDMKVEYLGEYISRIGDMKVEYRGEYISRIGDMKVEYRGEYISRIGDMKVEYLGEYIYRIGD